MNSLAATTFAKATVVKKNAESAKDWPMVRLGDVCETLTDGDWIESKDQSYEGIRLIQTGNVGDGRFLKKENRARYISLDTFQRLKCTEIFPGDVLVSRLPEPVGRACIVEDIGLRMITAVDCSIIRFTKDVYAKYFVMFSQSPKYQESISFLVTGTTRARISRKNLSSIQIPLPPIEVQKEIVERLEKELGEADKVAAEFKRTVELADTEFKAELDEVFGGLGNGVCGQELVSGDMIAHAKSAKSDVESQKSGTDFFNAEKQSSREAEAERGNVLTQRHKGTESWPMVRLGDVCEVKAGATHHGIESANGKYPVYGSGGYICQATECRCPAGTVTVGRKGTLDKPLLIEEPFWNIDTCFGVIPGETIDSKFLWLFCLNFDFYNLVPSLGRPSTNSEAIKNIQIPLPPLSVQKEIVAKLDAAKERCEKLKAEAERGLRASENLRKAILSEVFE